MSTASFVDFFCMFDKFNFLLRSLDDYYDGLFSEVHLQSAWLPIVSKNHFQNSPSPILSQAWATSLTKDGTNVTEASPVGINRAHSNHT